MMSKLPIDVTKLSAEELTRQNIRIALIAELDAVNLYEQLAANEPDEKVRKVFQSVTTEERTHIGEFSQLLLEKDPDQAQETEAGEDEVDRMD